MFTIALNIAAWLEMSLVNDALSGTSASRHRSTQERHSSPVRTSVNQSKDRVIVDTGAAELGEKIARTLATGGVLSHRPTPSHTQSPSAFAPKSSAFSEIDQ